MDPLNRLNKTFYQFDAKDIDKKMQEIEDEINRLRDCISFTCNEDIQTELLELLKKVNKFTHLSKSAKRLAYEIESLANTVFMPNEVVEKVFSEMDWQSLASMMFTNKEYCDLVLAFRERWLKSQKDRVVNEIFEAAEVIEFSFCFEEMDLDQMERFRVFEMVGHDKFNYYKRLARIDPQKALQESHELHIVWQSLVFNLVLDTLLGRGDIESARNLTIPDKVSKASTLGKIAAAVYPIDFEAGRALSSEALESAEGENVISAIIEQICPFEPEKALRAVSRIRCPVSALHACHYIAPHCPMQVLTYGKRFSGEVLQLDLIIFVAKEIMKTDIEKGRALIRHVISEMRLFPNNLRDLSKKIVVVLAPIDLQEALNFMDDQGLENDMLLQQICKSIPPAQAIGLLDRFEDRDIVIEDLINAILPHDRETVLQLILRVNSDYLRDRLYCKVVDSDIISLIEEPVYQAEALAILALGTKSDEKMTQALNLLREEKSTLSRRYAYIAILKHINDVYGTNK